MSDAARWREEALRSALGRLPVALIVCDEQRELRPLNDRAMALFAEEALTGDLLRARPSHPLAVFVQRILAAVPEERRSILEFPSGRRYAIEPSRRSEKGVERWIVLLIEPSSAVATDGEHAFDNWRLTGREKDVAQLMLRGLSNDAIAAEIRISTQTVKTHVARILEKSGCRSRAELVAKALRPG